MIQALAEAGREWSKEHPRFVEALTSAEQKSGAISAVFSSALHEITRRALDLPPPVRKPGDIDILVLPEHFGRLARGLGAAIVLSDVHFNTGDGLQAHMRAREAIAMVGNDEVQFMDPLSPLRVGRSAYKTAYTRDTAAHRLLIETDEGILPLVHPADDIGVSAMLQRDGDKYDQDKIKVQLATGALHDPHTLERARAMGWDERVWGAVEAAHLLLRADLVHMPLENQNGPH